VRYPPLSLPVPALALSDIDRQQVQQWVSALGTPQQVVLRCRIVLALPRVNPRIPWRSS